MSPHLYEPGCDFQRCGRFYGAGSVKAYRSLDKKLTDQPPGVTLNAEIVSPADQHNFIDSDHYHGGIVHHDHCSLDPGRYHQGLLNRAESLGVRIVGKARVTAIESKSKQAGGSSQGFYLSTSKGSLQASNVLVATNGYSDNLMPWARRRIIPIGSYMVATEELPQSTIERLIPKGRMVTCLLYTSDAADE